MILTVVFCVLSLFKGTFWLDFVLCWDKSLFKCQHVHKIAVSLNVCHNLSCDHHLGGPWQVVVHGRNERDVCVCGCDNYDMRGIHSNTQPYSLQEVCNFYNPVEQRLEWLAFQTCSFTAGGGVGAGATCSQEAVNSTAVMLHDDDLYYWMYACIFI